MASIVGLCLAPTMAMAADLQGTDGEDNVSSTGCTVTGTIQPLQIKAVVPTNITFEINPNQAANYTSTTGDALTAPSFSLENSCNAPLTFSVESLTAQADMPAVVAQDTFTEDEWKNLTNEQTKSNIAFGFVADTPDEWLSQENADEWFAPSTPLVFGDVAGNSSANLHLKAKYGMAWDNDVATQIVYDIVYKITLA